MSDVTSSCLAALMWIINQTKNEVLADNATLADTAASRLVGLLNRDSISPGEGLVITQCRSIHMFFMKFAIDVIFIDRSNKAIGLVPRIKPFQMSPYFLWANAAIELPEGVIEKTRTQVGDTIVFQDK